MNKKLPKVWKYNCIEKFQFIYVIQLYFLLKKISIIGKYKNTFIIIPYNRNFKTTMYLSQLSTNFLHKPVNK